MINIYYYWRITMKTTKQKGQSELVILFATWTVIVITMLQILLNNANAQSYTELTQNSSWSQINIVTLVTCIFTIFVIINLFNKNKLISSKLNQYEDKLTTIQSGINSVFDSKCESWGLTKAEKKIAHMLIRGGSIKNISQERGVSPTTVYRQMSNIYNKSSVNSVHEFVGIFTNEMYLLTERI